MFLKKIKFSFELKTHLLELLCISDDTWSSFKNSNGIAIIANKVFNCLRYDKELPKIKGNYKKGQSKDLNDLVLLIADFRSSLAVKQSKHTFIVLTVKKFRRFYVFDFEKNDIYSKQDKENTQEEKNLMMMVIKKKIAKKVKFIISRLKVIRKSNPTNYKTFKNYIILKANLTENIRLLKSYKLAESNSQKMRIKRLKNDFWVDVRSLYNAIHDNLINLAGNKLENLFIKYREILTDTKKEKIQLYFDSNLSSAN